MKLKALSVLAGLGGSLIVCDPAAARYLGLWHGYQPNPFGLGVCDVRAAFDNPNDRVLAVAGTAGAPLSVDAIGGTLYQHPTFGGETAPEPWLFGLFPSLEFDTFVTIGVKVNDGTDATQLTPGWPELGHNGLDKVSNLAWFVTPDDAQGMPDEDGRVLIGRFSSENGFPRGRFLILAISDGEPVLIYTGFCCILTPVPCNEGDVDGDHMVGVRDFLSMLAHWGPCPDPWKCYADLNGDGVVDIMDFHVLLWYWPPPAEPLVFVNADINGDGVANNIDLLTLLGCWGPVGAGCEAADLDGDGFIGVRDLLVLLAGWG
jgi:hypothetical protein